MASEGESRHFRTWGWIAGVVSAVLIVGSLLVIAPRWSDDARAGPIQPKPGGGTSIIEATMDVASITTLGDFVSSGGATLTSVELVHADPSVVVEDVRVSFLASKTRQTTQGGAGFAICMRWPPRGLGTFPTYELAGLTIAPGERFFVTFATTAKEPGHWRAGGVRLSYVTRDGKSYTVEDDGRGVELIRARTEAELPRGRANCNTRNTGGVYRL